MKWLRKAIFPMKGPLLSRAILHMRTRLMLGWRWLFPLSPTSPNCHRPVWICPFHYAKATGMKNVHCFLISQPVMFGLSPACHPPRICSLLFCLSILFNLYHRQLTYPSQSEDIHGQYKNKKKWLHSKNQFTDTKMWSSKTFMMCFPRVKHEDYRYLGGGRKVCKAGFSHR